MGDEQKTERVQIVMAPGDLRAIDDWSFERRIRSRSGGDPAPHPARPQRREATGEGGRGAG